ncbi:MAG TPA: class I adenylate-forming enzyme family protein [Candidatus Binatia bacterium]|nr:class I adenylate-forming enzyme family protein [Candidatus Binatia bacterium]
MNSSLNKMIEEEKTILTAFEASAEKYAERTALIFLGTRFSYRKLRELTYRFAAAASGLGIRAHDRVLIYLPNSPQWLIAYMGLQKIGAVPVPVSPIYPPYELTYLANHSRSKMIVCADTNFGYVKEVLPKTNIEQVIVTRIADLLPLGKRVFGKVFDKLMKGSVSRESTVLFFRRLIRKYPPTPPPLAIDPKSHIAHLLYTGGTTGFPKGVPHGHLELLSGIVGIREVYRSCIKEADNTLVMPLPLFHMFSQDMVFAVGLHLGNTVVIAPKPNVDAVSAAVQDYRGTLLAGVPSLYRLILENDRLDFYDLRSLKFCWSAGDALPEEVSSRWTEKVGIPIYQVYGSTECVCISVTSPAQEPAPRSVGRLIPTRLAKVLDPEAQQPVPPGEAGELLVSSDYSYVMKGYLQNPAETKETFVEVDGRTWCRTGDHVKMSADGEIEFIDRRADLIKHKGYRVSAARVESVLQDHPAVVAACVVGVPDTKAGEQVKAFVILKADIRGVTSYDLTRHCRERLLPYEVPDYIEFRDMLPKSKIGKLLRREMRDEEQRRAAKP